MERCHTWQQRVLVASFVLVAVVQATATPGLADGDDGSSVLAAPTRLRVEYLEEPISIDSLSPRFSWALPSDCRRGSVQASYRLVVMTAPVGERAVPEQVWDSGTVKSNQTLNIHYASATKLLSDTDYSWSVTWTDQSGATSMAGNSTFSVAILGQEPVDWGGASWVSSAENGSLSTYRAEFSLPSTPVRARLHYAGLGYAKAWVNGNATDEHELGQYVTFQERVLYDSVDVLRLLRKGKNVLGLMLGNGWLEPRGESSALAPRQFIALLTVTATDGTVTRFHSSTVAASPHPAALLFHATVGPAQTEDMFKGEDFDGRVAAALTGWSRPEYTPIIVADSMTDLRVPVWVAATAPLTGPDSWGSSLNAHHAANIIQTKEIFTPANISQPVPGKYVFDFAQNMAGQVTLRVPSCPVGTVISMQHTEVLSRNGQVRNSFCLRPKKWLCGLRQFANYTCSGVEPVEEYRVMFTSMGFRYVEVSGFPGIPTTEALTAHFVHSDVPQAGKFVSSSSLLNAIQHATLYSAASNQMDLPTDCPQRERQGWLGDAQLAFETVAHNFDVGAFYTKWVRDLGDVQVFDAKTLSGAMPDTCPCYSSSSSVIEADPGWAIAAWVIPTQFSSYYDDDRLERAFYPHQVSYMEHWILLAQQNGGELPPTLQHSGDWGCMQPGPNNCGPVEYSQYFYTTALALQAQCATQLGKPTDAARYGKLLKMAAQLYIKKYFHSESGCFGNCTDISQIFGLTLAKNHGMLSPDEEMRAWSKALAWFGENGRYEGRFGGGIVSFKLLYPLLDAFGMSDLGLKQQLHTDKPPSLGYWIAQGGTTLFEYWGNAEFSTPNLLNSYNHIMFGGSGSWYYSTLAGLRRAPGSRSWKELIIAPPAPGTISDLTWANASIDTPMGVVGSAWRFDNTTDSGSYSLHATVPPNALARVIMPTLVAPAAATITDGGSVVWAHGVFWADTGVHNAVSATREKSVVFEVGSGEYFFTTRQPSDGKK